MRQESIPEFMERDPNAYAKCVELLEAGHSPGGAAALCRIPIQLARKIRNLMGESAISAGIRQVARNLTEASQLMSERLVDEADQIPINALPNALGIVVDRTSLLVGQPTVRIEHKNVPSPEDLRKMFDALPQINAVDVSKERPEPPKPLPLKSKQTS
jgi:hypothetical protein